MTAAFGRTTAHILIEIGAVHFRPHDPFILTSGRASPVYIDCRKVISFPRARRKIVEMMGETVEATIGFESLDAVAGGETAGIPYAAWLAEADMPKLFINADPGSILVGRQRELCRAWPNQTEVTVRGRHFLQEDSPDEIGHALAEFVRRVRSQ